MRLKVYRYLHEVTAPSRRGLAWFDLIEIGLVALGFLLYFGVRGAVVDRDAAAIANAQWIIDFQDSIGLFIEPQINEWALTSDLLVRFFNFVYFWLDFPLIIAVGLFLFWQSRTFYTLFRDALLISGGIALVMYWSIPVAPPRFMTEYGFVDTLKEYSDFAYQAQSTAAFVNPYAAVPSLHVGWAVILAIVVFWVTRNWLLRVAGVAVLIAQSIAVVATANHYILDGVIGAAVCLVALWIAVWLQRSGYPGIRRWLAARLGEARPEAATT